MCRGRDLGGPEGTKPRRTRLDLPDTLFDRREQQSRHIMRVSVRSCVVSGASCPQMLQPRPSGVPDWPAYEVSSPLLMPRQTRAPGAQYKQFPDLCRIPACSGKRKESLEKPPNDQ